MIQGKPVRLHKGVGMEAIRLLSDGPSWKPAKNESGDIEDVVRMRIVFKRQ